jgi:cysteine-rich repeat protein
MVIASLALAGAAHAEYYSWERTILNPTPGEVARFGASLATRGNDLVIGRPNFFPYEVPGAAWLFDVSGSMVREYPNPTLDGGDEFARSVATLGDDVLIGAWRDAAAGADAGAAYLFDGDTGTLLQTFVDPTSSLFFGYTVAGGGGLAYVADINNNTVHVFDPVTGSLLGTLNNPAPLEGGALGAAIAVSATTVAVGAPAGKGAVHLFDAATGTFRRTIPNPNPGPGPAPYFDEQFGASLAWIGDTLLVGNWTDGDETGLPDAGAAYLFDSASGALLHTLVSAAPSGSGYFGYAVGSVGSLALVGALNEGPAGAVTAFDTTTGALVQTITPPVPITFQFGQAVTGLGDRIAVGAPFDPRGSPGSGAVFLFDPCGNGRQVADEDCDDGNTIDGDGCPATCRFPRCPATPATCREAAPSGALFALKAGFDTTRDAITWKWSRGATGTVLGDFGNPTVDPRGYRLCMYDEGIPRLRGEWRAPAGPPGWSARPSGYRYKKDDLLPNGLRVVQLKAASDPLRTKLVVKGKGTALALSSPPFIGAVRVQLHNDDTGLCWNSTFSAPTRNNAGRYRARSD